MLANPATVNTAADANSPPMSALRAQRFLERFLQLAHLFFGGLDSGTVELDVGLWFASPDDRHPEDEREQRDDEAER